MWFVAVVGVTLGVAACCVLLLAWRRRRQLRTGGIDVVLRVREDERGRGWHWGVAHYRGDEFAWYRVLSLRSGPSWMLNRRDVDIARRREPSTAETNLMPAGATVLALTDSVRDIEVGMGPDALTGFLSWLESAPPGKSVRAS